jgi:mannosyltransferase
MKKRFNSFYDNFVNLKKPDWLFIAPVVVVFSAIVLATITKFSIWFDEAFGAYLIRFNFFDIARYTATDVHPPLYYWLLQFWSYIFGTSELGLRSMSLFFGVLSLIVAYILLKRVFSVRAAQFGIVLMAISPMLVRYSQEMRMYTVVLFIALLATLVLTIAVESKKRLPWTIYGILIALGMWTHYFAAVVWIAHWVWRAIDVSITNGRKKWLGQYFSAHWVWAHLVAVAVFAPWAGAFIAQSLVLQVGGFWIGPVNGLTIPNYLTNAVFYLDLGDVTGWLVPLFWVFIIAAIGLSVRSMSQMKGHEKRYYALLICLAVIPIVTLILLSMPPMRSSFVDRYLITSAVALALVLGVAIAYSTKYMGKIAHRLASVFIVAVMLVGVVNVWQIGNYNKNSKSTNQTRQITQLAVDNGLDGQPIIVATPWLFYEVVFYETASHPVYFINTDYPYGSLDMVKYNPQHKIMDMELFTKEHPVFWYIYWSDSGEKVDPADNLVKIQTLELNDPVGGKPAYHAVQYRAN